jgi:DNA-directed RNA polymerase specialized sigma24 family protein
LLSLLESEARSRMTEAEVWSLVMDNEALLRREVRRYVPGHRRRDRDYFDDLYSTVVLTRAHAIMRTYRSEAGVLPITHLCANVRWYAYERVLGRKYKRVPEPVDMTDGQHDSATTDCAMHTNAQVKELLTQLPQAAADLLEWHLVKGYTFDEIAVYMNITRAQAKTQYQEALELARGTGVYRRMTRWLEALLDDET